MNDNNTTKQASDRGTPTEQQAAHQEFRAVLSPYRSLSPKGFFIFMLLLAGVSFIAGVVFVLNGAWPVMGFFGLDVLIIYVAFKLNYRSGRLLETVGLTRDNLKITRVHPSGREEIFDFNPYWVRVKFDEGKNGRTQLSLYHHQESVIFGKFLTDDERREFAIALKIALQNLKGGVRI